jgi:hypothetical protein
MAQGCNLPVDDKDWKDIKNATLNVQISKNDKKSARENAREMFLNALKRPDALIRILNDTENINYKKAKLALEVAMIVEHVPENEKNKLVPALKTILAKHKKLPGMFKAIPKSRGPGSGPMVQHFELTATAKLCQLGQQGQAIRSSTGMKLNISPSDEIRRRNI